jgi:hypothetical protein
MKIKEPLFPLIPLIPYVLMPLPEKSWYGTFPVSPTRRLGAPTAIRISTPPWDRRASPAVLALPPPAQQSLPPPGPRRNTSPNQ